MMNVKAIPDGYASITPYFMVRGAAKAIDFYKLVFNATERVRVPGPEGRVAHAELEIGGSLIMLADECPESISKGPETTGGTPVCLHLYIEDCDGVFAKGLAAGATEVEPLTNRFYGDRAGLFKRLF